MLPLINGKSFLSCAESDLLVLLDNEDYRENEYIDYKLSFAFLEIEKGKEREKKKIEFKIDVCSFANADGGYLIFGIQDNNGCASAIKGIDIPNDDTDRFELDRRNDLNGIQPKIPSLKFAFIRLETGKYVVVISIKHDSFCPYIYLEGERNYRIYRRYGNRKKTMSYTELRQMFIQATSLEQSISNYLYQRIAYYRNLGNSFGNSFLYLSFIPETFSDSNYRQNMFVLERAGTVKFSEIFSALSCSSSSIPCVDGIRFIPYSEYYSAECYVKNNGIVEACLSLDRHLKSAGEKYPDGYLPWAWLWDRISDICYHYLKSFANINMGERVFLCLSIVGCRNVVTEDKAFQSDYLGKIDRDEIICDPIEVIKTDDSYDSDRVLKQLQIAFLLAIGVKYNESLKQLIDDVYGNR